jgi:hypothetical protein
VLPDPLILEDGSRVSKHGIEADQMPPVNEPIMRDISFHCHAGKHEVLPFDWDQYLRFADLHWR